MDDRGGLMERSRGAPMDDMGHPMDNRGPLLDDHDPSFEERRRPLMGDAGPPPGEIRERHSRWSRPLPFLHEEDRFILPHPHDQGPPPLDCYHRRPHDYPPPPEPLMRDHDMGIMPRTEVSIIWKTDLDNTV